MHKGLARADLMALGLQDARALLADPSQAKRMTDEALEKIEKLARPLGRRLPERYREKAQALANRMVLGSTTSRHLLRNAHAIAYLLGEKGGPAPDQVTPALVDAIDQLVTLYAWDKLDVETRQGLADLMASEQKGIETVTGFLNVIRQQELERRDRHGGTNLRAQFNGWKGYVPATVQEGASLIVAGPDQHEQLVKRGYVKIGPYRGDGRDRYGEPRAYYQSTVAAVIWSTLGLWRKYAQPEEQPDD